MAVDLERRLAGIDDTSTVPIARWAGTGALVTGDLDAARYWPGRCVERATKNVERAVGLNLLAFAVLAREGVTLPRSRLDGQQGSGSADYSLAAEALARSKLIAMLDGIDPGLLDRIDWAWVESTVTPRAITELQDARDVSGLARRVLKTQE